MAEAEWLVIEFWYVVRQIGLMRAYVREGDVNRNVFENNGDTSALRRLS